MERVVQSPLKSAKLIVKKSTIHGYGVFAAEDIAEGEVIEECYALPVETRISDLQNYYFNGDEKDYVVLGYGSIYNHSDEPNAKYRCEPDASLFVYTARRFIKTGDEIFVYYGDKWFSSRQLPKLASTNALRLRHLKRISSQLSRFLLVVAFIFCLLQILQQ